MTHDTAIAVLIHLRTASVALLTAIETAGGHDQELAECLRGAFDRVQQAQVACGTWASATTDEE